MRAREGQEETNRENERERERMERCENPGVVASLVYFVYAYRPR
jgi:hypothetical protein